MMKKIIFGVLLNTLLNLTAGFCQPATAFDIVKKSDEKTAFNDETSKMSMG